MSPLRRERKCQTIPITASRLTLLAALLAATTGFLAQAAPAWAAAAQLRAQAPGFYRMMLGDFEITALLDGTHPFLDPQRRVGNFRDRVHGAVRQ